LGVKLNLREGGGSSTGMEGSALVPILPTTQGRRMNSDGETWVSFVEGKEKAKRGGESGSVFEMERKMKRERRDLTNIVMMLEIKKKHDPLYVNLIHVNLIHVLNGRDLLKLFQLTFTFKVKINVEKVEGEKHAKLGKWKRVNEIQGTGICLH